MKCRIKIIIAILFVISILLNLILFINIKFLKNDNKSIKSEMNYVIEERNFLNTLIPELNPQVDKKTLEKLIIKIYPNERIEILRDHIRWRFFNFWFSSEDKLEMVTYGS